MSGVGKEAVGTSSGKETTSSTNVMNVDPTSVTETKNQENLSSKAETGTNCDEASASLQEPETVARAALVECGSNLQSTEDNVGENSKVS